MLGIRYLIAAPLSKLRLDVLEDAEDNRGNQHIPLGRNRQMIEELAARQLDWRPYGGGTAGSEATHLTVSAVEGRETEYPEQELLVQIQGGVREGEVKLPRQRNDPLKIWSDPVRESRPTENTAYIMLLRDESDQIHARYVGALEALPLALRTRVRAAGETVSAFNFREEGEYVLEDPVLARVIESLRRRKNVILYGPPGTGKTRLMREAQHAFEEGISPVVFDPTDLSEPFKEQQTQPLAGGRNTASWFVTFHQSTSYETFVAGLMPEISSDGALQYVVRAGPLIEAADHACDGGASLLLIDEINRGNTAEIFGELVTILEPDKRLAEDGKIVPFETILPRLPYAPDANSHPAITPDGQLQMPYHVYTLGSMNSVDRMVAPLDSALRRRFHIIEVPPDQRLLRLMFAEVLQHVAPDDKDEWRKVFNLAYCLLARVNKLISIFRGPDFQLGHAYLWPVFSNELLMQDRRRALISLFLEGVVPQLIELFRADPEALYLVLGGPSNDGRLFRRHTLDAEPLSEESGYFDAPGWVELMPLELEDEESTLAIIANVAGVSPGSRWTDDQADASDAMPSGNIEDDVAAEPSATPLEPKSSNEPSGTADDPRTAPPPAGGSQTE